MSPARKAGWGLLLTCGLLAAATAHGAEPAPPAGPADVVVPPLEVRGRRESRDLREDRAAAGAVILPTDVDDAGLDLPQVLDRAAGVRVTRLGGPAAFSTLSIRGSTADQVTVVLDGVPLNTAAGGPVDLSRIPLGHLERVEIYRGASPVTFGGSAIGGVLSLRTRTVRARELSLAAGGGSFGARAARFFYAEPFDSWGFGIGLDYVGAEGDFPFVNDRGTRFDPRDDTTEPRQNNHFDQLNLLGSAQIQLGGPWRLSVTEWLFWRRQGVPGLGQFPTAAARYDTLDNLVAATLEAPSLAGQVDLRLQAAFRATRSRFADPRDEIGLANDSGADLTLAPSVSATAVWRPLAWWDLTGVVQYQFERFAPSRASQAAAESTRHRLTAGLESGFYLDALHLALLPSARLEWSANRRTAGERATPFAADEAGLAEGTFRAALVFTGIPDTKLSVSGGRAVRLPSLFELFGNTGRVLGNPALSAEAAYTVDGGVVWETTLLPEPYRLRLEAFGFFSDVTDLIQYVQTAQGTARAENVDRATLAGLEAGIRADLFGHLRLHGNYTWLVTENTGDIAARAARRLPLRPASQWYARAEGYVTEIPGVTELAVFVDAEWVAGNFLDNANLVAVPSRFLLHVGLAVEFVLLKTRLSFSAQNLTDERTADLLGYPLPGRSFHVQLALQVL